MEPKFDIEVYSDGAIIDDMREVAKHDYVTGFTTNPSLMKKAGITNYMAFAKQVLSEFPGYSISFEVFGHDKDTMLKEAKTISALSPDVFVKIPVLLANGDSNADLIHELSHAGVKVNVTAIATIDQVKEALAAVDDNTDSIISIFVGRVADAGNDSESFVTESVKLTNAHPKAKLLWASTREVYNVYQAQAAGVDIITVPPTILAKLAKVGKSPLQVSLDTVKGFDKDITELGFSILD
ncbi:transaldolase family protein [Paucilactobacillus sp. N302-9]